MAAQVRPCPHTTAMAAQTRSSLTETKEINSTCANYDLSHFKRLKSLGPRPLSNSSNLWGVASGALPLNQFQILQLSLTTRSRVAAHHCQITSNGRPPHQGQPCRIQTSRDDHSTRANFAEYGRTSEKRCTHQGFAEYRRQRNDRSTPIAVVTIPYRYPGMTSCRCATAFNRSSHRLGSAGCAP